MCHCNTVLYNNLKPNYHSQGFQKHFRKEK
uniref:Uncharacterized protein n=1 Tax=Anguilla anguilla TaxID=7936 RepID=A0A0E9XRH0_ANGAN